MKTTELSGAALDWAVAKCEFGGCEDWDGTLYGVDSVSDLGGVPYKPSTNWAQGEPIIEREGIETTRGGAYVEHFWKATRHSNAAYGPTPLIAAMRCYVASKLRDTVNIPAEVGGDV